MVLHKIAGRIILRALKEKRGREFAKKARDPDLSDSLLPARRHRLRRKTLVGLRNYRRRWCRRWRGLHINRSRLHIDRSRLDVSRRYIHRRGTYVNAHGVRAVTVGNSNPNSHSPPRLRRCKWQNQKGESGQWYYSSEHRSILLSSVCGPGATPFLMTLSNNTCSAISFKKSTSLISRGRLVRQSRRLLTNRGKRDKRGKIVMLAVQAPFSAKEESPALRRADHCYGSQNV